MKFSKKWLQSYSKEPLPETKILEDLITLNAFEIEEITSYGDDDILDLKILPNRAHDALGHRGVARDIVALTGNTFVDPSDYYSEEGDKTVLPPKISVEDGKACTRFMSVRIENVVVTQSPEWLKTALESIGQKSINSIVDVTNYVQFAINKPMHAYDASLVEGGSLNARFAKEGEILTTLDNKELVLKENTLVIADTVKPLGLAGIKGGKFSGISEATTSLILESANFNASLIRTTSQQYAIRTDASKRFENELSDSLAEEGLRMTITLIKKLNPSAKVSEIVDVFPVSEYGYQVAVSVDEINKKLGTMYSKEDVATVFNKINFTYQVIPLKERIKERMNEVVGAVYKNPSSMRLDAPKAFSCSSLVSYLFLGVWQPSISIDKFVFGQKVDNPIFGDLIFSNTGQGKIYTESVDFLSGTSVPSGIDHVGLCIGEGKVFHISRRTNTPVVEDITTSPSFSSGVMYARVANIEEEYFFVSVPKERLDIRIKEDLIEEVVRIKGLSSVPVVMPSLNRIGLPHKRMYYENKIKNILFAKEFSDIMTYSFGSAGEVKIKKGLATDKEFLRNSLSVGLLSAFALNMQNAPLLKVNLIKLYEFGNVFSKNGERREFALLIDDGKKKTSYAEDVDFILSEIKRSLSVDSVEYTVVSTKPYCVVIDFDALIANLPNPKMYESLTSHTLSNTYTVISPYPFIVRDIACFVPMTVSWENVFSVVTDAQKSPLVVSVDLFDTFTKNFEDGTQKISYAFRMVLQSHERTLTDIEANSVADVVYQALKGQGWELR
jgi:phenylalanyl-tRNA synthetase beta subunit